MRRITPQLNLPEVSAATRNPVSGGVGRVAAPRPDTSVASGLAAFSRGLEQYDRVRTQEAQQEAEDYRDEAFVEVRDMPLEELKKFMLNEEGKTILEGMAPQRAHYFQEFAGIRLADSMTSIYDAALRAKLTDPGRSDVDILGELEAAARKELSFQDHHSVVFRRAALSRMDELVMAEARAVTRARGAQVQEFNHQQTVSTSAQFLESYSYSDDPGRYENMDLKLKTLMSEAEENTGVNVIDALWEGMDLNLESAVRNLTQDTDLHALKVQLEAAKKFSTDNGDFNQYREQYQDSVAKLEKARMSQESWEEGDDWQTEQRDRAREDTKFRDGLNTWLAEMGADAFRDMIAGNSDREIFDLYVSTLDEAAQAEANARFSQFSGLVHGVRNAAINPLEGEAAEALMGDFFTSLRTDQFRDIEEANKELTDLQRGGLIDVNQVIKLRQEVDVWFNSRGVISRRAVSLATPEAAPALNDAFTELRNELAQAEVGFDWGDGANILAEDQARLSERWNAAEQQITGRIARRLEYEITEVMAESGGNIHEASSSLEPRMSAIVSEEVSRFRKDMGWDTEMQETTTRRINRKTNDDLLKENSAWQNLLDADVDVPFEFVDESIQVINDPTATPQDRKVQWDEAGEAYRAWKVRDDHRRGDPRVVRAVNAVRAMGHEPFTWSDLRQMSKDGVDRYGNEVTTTFQYDATQTLYFKSLEDLGNMTDKEAEWFLKLHRKHIGKITMEEFVRAQGRLIKFYGIE